MTKKSDAPAIRFKGFSDAWEQRKLGELALFNPKDELPQIFEYVDLESVVGTEMLSHRTEVKSSAPSRAQRLAHTGDLFYQTVRPYQKNNYLFEKPDNNYVFSTGYAQMRPYVDGYFLLSLVQSERFVKVVLDNCTGTSYPAINANDLAEIEVAAPSDESEAQKIGTIFRSIDNLITLHQRKCISFTGRAGRLISTVNKKRITSSWEQRKFSDITFPAGEKNRDNLPLESYSITNEHGFVPQDEKFENGGTMREADKRMYYIVSPNSFAYNPARINVGSIGYQNIGKNVIVSSLYEVFKTSEDVDDRLLWHWFKSPDFQKLIMQLQEGGVRLYFYYDKLCMGEVSLPSLEEQRKIGKLFDTLDNLITLHQRKFEKLTNVKKSMLEKMFPQNGSSYPEIRFKGFTDPWEQRKLCDVVKEITRNDPESEAPIMMITANNGFIEQSERYAFNNAGESLKKYILLKKGELAYNHGASKLRPYGSCFALTTAENARIPFVYHCFSAENQNAEFMSIELNGAEIENQLRKIVSSGARMDGLLNISFDEYTSVSVLLPGIEEQDCIADFFRQLDNLITLHQRELEKLQNIKKSMLEKMFV